ncbi:MULTISPECIES: DUF881 domain-containing protein [Rossellomorea]|jgi:uncharacterized protein YlxW (UPF0749 family)|uniref:DUF881 domain-containing protein n=2 Tax=Rossellomorea vietnamensis TaxID=218284 RepID=A0A6I6URV1_9BACI|nr:MULTISPECIES: DUF881 domain-containing protein [Rossellomorea]MCA0148723.1 DUF881 domain-containing protein [Rossellomorea vietnamensis]MCC5802682.1 DUF881 domain-containing protein [Rossellomorea vietnamensis]QHE61216.1 DUF881 domain-containing protein [Rossellomorea vietnamensis]WGG47435.1 DUF881 domain-containing protein [Rossellomorea sp. DA94]
MKRMKVRGKHVVLSLVCLVLGFILAFSFSLANTEQNELGSRTNGQWKQEETLRDQILEYQQKNNRLQEKLYEKQEKVGNMEKEFSKEKQIYFNLAEDAEKYRMYLGKTKVKGPGVTVTLSDAKYDPEEENANNYIVHEHHVFKVINELYIAGASAVAINGQRLKHDSYILCNGPVIQIDGIEYPAPFKITAIGDPEVLSSAMNITGGVKDQLVNENIIFEMKKENSVILEPTIGES